MKQTTLSLLFTFFICGSIVAQCSLPSGAAGTGCTDNITNGVFTGTLTIESGSTITLPGNGITGFAGAVNISLENNSGLTLSNELTVAEGTTFTIGETNGNPILAANGTTYTKNSNPNFDDLAALLDGCASPGGCTVGALLGALPVSLTAWSASPNEKGDGVNLEWSSQSESGNDYFFVEHSLDGAEFRELARLGSQGAYNAAADYFFQHTEVEAGTHFYRLGQRDMDGTISLFTIHRVTLTGSNEISIFPNPATVGSVININQVAAVGQIRLLDLNGRQIGLQPAINIDGQTSVQLPASLKPGLYLLQTEKGSVRVTIR
jgi:hypothetical protein